MYGERLAAEPWRFNAYDGPQRQLWCHTFDSTLMPFNFSRHGIRDSRVLSTPRYMILIEVTLVGAYAPSEGKMGSVYHFYVWVIAM